MKIFLQFKISLLFSLMCLIAFSQSVNTTISGDLTYVSQPNETINYTIEIENLASSGQNYNNIQVGGDSFVQNLAYASGDDNTDDILNSGETWVYNASFLVNQAIFDMQGIPFGSNSVTYNVEVDLSGVSTVDLHFEVNWTTGINSVDADGDGVIDFQEQADGTDVFDGCDFIPSSITQSQTNNWYNLDCDGDGIPNEAEFFDSAASNYDTDDDGVMDINDIDDDGDGIRTIYESLYTDQDGDNLLDYLDQDADGDAIPDNIEFQTTMNYVSPTGMDINSDGLDDAYETITTIENSDDDQIPDFLDFDSDNDGINDEIESGLTQTGLDVDQDGLDDGIENNAIGFLFPNGIVQNPALDLLNSDGINDVDYRDTPCTIGPVGTPENIEVCNDAEPLGIVLDDYTSGNNNTFSWIASNNPDVTGETITVSTDGVISDTLLLNSTGVMQFVEYTITPTSQDGCQGAPFVITVHIFEAPIGTDYSVAINSGEQLSVVLDNLVNVSDNFFMWMAIENNSVTGESIELNDNDVINDTLENYSGIIQDVTYIVTPTSILNYCVGDDFHVIVTVNPGCAAPTDFNVSSIGTDSASLNWNQGANETSWQLRFQGSTIDLTSTTYDFTNLVADTTYTYEVRGVCGTGGYSEWAIGTFHTAVAAPTCGGQFLDSGGLTNNYTDGENITTTISPAVTGEVITVQFTQFNTENAYDGMMVYNGPDTTYPLIDSGSTYDRMTCPNGAFTGETNFAATNFTSTDSSGALTFVFTSDSSITKTGWEANITCNPPPTCFQPTDIELISSSTSSTTIDVSWTDNNPITPVSGWEIQYGPIGFTLGAGTIIPALSNPFSVGNLQNGTAYDFYVKANCGANISDDDSLWTGPVWLYTLDSCIEIGNLQEVSVTADSATISWSDLNIPLATTWEVEIVLNGTQPTGTGVSTTDNPYTATGLQASTLYDAYVRVDCGSGDFSSWAQAITFDTLAIPPACGEILTDSGGIANDYTNNEDYTTTICPDVAGEVVTVQFTAFNVEVNFDQLNIYDGDDTNATLLGEFDGTDLPPTFTSTATTGCLTFVFTSDTSVTKTGWEANVICGPPPTCFAVSMLNLDTVTEDMATISWLDTNSPQSATWEYEIVLADEPQTLNGITISDNPLMITNLTAGTQYDIYIRSSCGAGDFSFWEMLSFTTTQGCMEVTNLDASAINEFSAVIDWNDTNNPIPAQWEIEYGLTGFTQGNGTTFTSQTPNIMLDTLQENTAYDVYVRAVCSQNDFSNWSVINFITTIDTPLDNTPYNVSVIPFQIYGQPLPDTMNMDDGYTDLIPLNFNFNYFGIDYHNVAIGTNSVLSFNVADAGNSCDWNINSNDVIPSVSIIDNAILGAYQDYDNRGGMSGTQVYGFIGTAPFRKFVVAFDDVALYSSACDGIRSSNQMIIYETYNYIDVQVLDRNVCNSWNNGNAIIGIQNIGGTEAYFPSNRNVGNWEAHNEGYRFKPEFDLLDFQYIICDANVDGIADFDLSVVSSHFDNGTSGISYSIHESKMDAENNVNPISGIYSNTSNSQVIFVRKDDTNVGEVTIMNALLAAIDCAADYDLDTIPTMDEDLNGNGNFGDDDTDGDQIPDFIDEDDDGDFILTDVEAVVTHNSTASSGTSTTSFLDTDGDQIPNYLDNDDDGDGVLTINEDYDGDGNPANDDTNNNGIPDYLEQSVALGTTENLISEFLLFPNPVKDILTVQFENLQSEVTVTIYSLQGQEVYKKESISTNETQIDVANLSTGIYFVNISTDGKTVTQKFVKE